MKITFALQDIRLGGGNRAVLEISKRLMLRGHKVSIVYPFAPVDQDKIRPRKILFDLAANLKRRNKIRWFKSEVDLIPAVTFQPRLKSAFSSFFPDADCVLATAWQTALPVSELPDSKGKKFYFVQHYEIWPLWNSEECWRLAVKSGLPDISLAFARMRPLEPSLARYKDLVDQTYRLPLKIITTSRWLAEMLEQGLGAAVHKLVGIGNSFDLFSKIECAERQTLRILMQYRSSAWKGDKEVSAALAIIKERYPQVQIVIFGGRNPPALPFQAEYHPIPTDADLCRLYSSSDIFVCGSWIEGWGSPPMEAMACGAAVVTTAVGGMPEFSEHLKSALHVAPRSVDQIVQAVSYLIENESRRKEIAREGEIKIREFSWERCVDLFESALLKPEQKLVGNFK